MAGEVLQAFPKAGPELAELIEQAAIRLGCNPVHLAAVINFESGFNVRARNRLSGATGLIQFMPKTAQALGTSTDALSQMTASDQMAYVEAYFRPYVGRLGTLQAVALAVFYPAYMSKPEDTPFPSAVQKWNPGIKTPRDYVAKVTSNAGSAGRSYL